MRKTSEAGFLTELSERAGFCPKSAEIYGRGTQSIVALASGGNIFKAYNATIDMCGIQTAQYEAAILAHIGGYEGNLLRTPALKSHHVFKTPFEWETRKFVSVVEQSFIPGSQPYTPAETRNIGNTLAELHGLLASRLQDIPLPLERIPESRLNWIAPGGYMETHLPAVTKRLRRYVSDLMTSSTLSPVHGDFIDLNIKVDKKKYGVLDFARVGLSVPEQDMITYARLPLVLNEIFAAYADVSGYKPDKHHVRTLHALNMGLMAEVSNTQRNTRAAAEYAYALQAYLR